MSVKLGSQICDLNYLRAQTLGYHTTFETPFGSRYLTYADYIASGRNLQFVEDYILHIQETYANTHTEDDMTGRITTKMLHKAEDEIKKAVNANEKNRIISIGTGATGAVHKLQEILGVTIPPATHDFLENTIKESLGEEAFERFMAGYKESRPVVFLGPYEHHSNEVTWREGLVETVIVPYPREGVFDLEALENAVSDPKYANRRKIGSFSAASNVTGLKSPVYEIAKIMHKHGGIAIFDYAAGAPYMDINMNKDDESYFDAIFLSPHKFLGGPGGAGLLIFREELYRSDLPPTIGGGGTVDYVSPNGHAFVEDIEEREKAGTPGSLQVMKTALSFLVKEEIGIETIEKVEADYIRRAMERFAENEKVHVLGNPDPEKRLSILSFNIFDGDKRILHPKLVTKLLNDLFGIQSRAGCSCAGPYGHSLLEIEDELSEKYQKQILCGYNGFKPGWVRVGFHFIFTEEDFQFILDAIEFIAEHGHLFLSEYNFCLKSGTWYYKNEDDDFNSPEFSIASAMDAKNCDTMVSAETRHAAYKQYMAEARETASRLSVDAKDYKTFKPELEDLRFFNVTNLLDDLK